MEPMLATRGDAVPSGPAWSHEIKWDGVRALAAIRDGGLRLSSRGGNDLAVCFPELAPLAESGGELGDALLDGEIICLSGGRPSFAAVADRIQVRDPSRARRLADQSPATYMIFDAPRLGGSDLGGLPLSRRRELLEAAGLDGAPGGAWQLPAAYQDGAALLSAAREQGLEGIISKRLASRYQPGRRSPDWLKFPLRPTASFTVAGFRREADSATRIGSLVLAEPEAGGLAYRGRVGSGISGRAERQLRELLEGRPAPAPGFAATLGRAEIAGVVWVRPGLVVDVEHLARTADGRLRHPVYRGLRLDLSDVEGSAPTEGTRDG